MFEKICSYCKTSKPRSDFSVDRNRKDGLSLGCSLCRQRRRIQTKETDAARKKLYYEKNRQRIIEKVNARTSLKLKEVTSYKREWRRRKTKEDMQFKLREALRRRFWMAFSCGYKEGSAVRDLGCSIAEFKIYLESLFHEGMSWDNWGLGEDCWHIDHQVPLSAFDLTNRQHVVLACHYLNLQPMWSIENLSKGARYEYQAA